VEEEICRHKEIIRLVEIRKQCKGDRSGQRIKESKTLLALHLKKVAVVVHHHHISALKIFEEHRQITKYN
jgi:hypothetical protein